jgi:hypothetical protein
MIGKSLLAGALALVPISSQATLPPPTFIATDFIEKISCLALTDEGLKTVSGTGFKLADGRWVSVNHVTKNIACTVDGLPITVTHSDELGDFSTFTVPGDNRGGGFEIDCAGYQEGQWYHAQGFARGLSPITSLPVMFSKLMQLSGMNRGWAVLIYNAVIPGQSGGPMVSREGRAVGTNNAYNPFYPVSFSRQLKDTIICSQS